MYSKSRQIVKLLTPPIFVQFYRSLFNRTIKKEWEYCLEGWLTAQSNPDIKGWNVQSVVEAYQASWPKFAASLQGSLPLGGGPDATLTSHNTIISFAYAITLASYQKSVITMLDWGGGVGHYYLISRAILPPQVTIKYSCKDVPILCEYGRQQFPEATFYEDDRYLSHQFDFTLVSGSLQYAIDWKTTLYQIAKITGGYIFVTRLPVVQNADSFVVLQRAYNTGYLGWVFNRTEFISGATEIGLELVREFLIDGKVNAYAAPEKFEFRGFLFRKIAVEKRCDVS